jgi:FkbM family methyltransferase
MFLKRIFLDCGTHLGQALRHFQRQGVIDRSWEIHAFEANPACHLAERVNRLDLHVTPHECAVWITDGVVAFYQENHQRSNSGSPTDGRSTIDGWGSSVAAVAAQHPGYEPEMMVPCIDFSRFIRELPDTAEIVCKLNVEGSEFPVLRRMLSERTIDRISKLYVEFHQWMIPSETDQSVHELVSLIKDRGVIVDLSEIYQIPYSL